MEAALFDTWLGDPSNRDFALTLGEERFSPRDLKIAADRCSRELTRASVTSQSCVIFRIAPGLDWFGYLLALSHIGAQVIVLDHRLESTVTNRMVALAGADHELFSAQRLAPTINLTQSKTLLHPLGGSGRKDESHFLQLSSGTTSDPKLCRRFEQDIRAEVNDYRVIGPLAEPGHRIVLASSLASAWGFYGAVASSFANGAELVVPKALTPRGTIDIMARNASAPSHLHTTPTHATMISQSSLSASNFTPWTTVRTSGGSINSIAIDGIFRGSSVLRRTQISQVYGMTEVGLIAANLNGDHPPGSVGKIAPRHQIALSDEGELRIARPESPYLNRTNDQRWDGEWFDTRDSVRFDSGNLLVVGRIDGLVSFGGKKFYVDEVEAHIKRNSDVVESVVLINGVEIEAFVELKKGVRLDRASLASPVPEYMRPHHWYEVDSLPRTTSGKISRRRDLIVRKHGDEQSTI